MLEVTCGWSYHDKTDLNKLIKKNERLAKLVLLWRNGHITDQHFLPNVIKPWEPNKVGEDFEDFNELRTPYAVYRVLVYALGSNRLGQEVELNNFIKQYWPYFSPDLNWKIKVNFTEGQMLWVII